MELAIIMELLCVLTVWRGMKDNPMRATNNYGPETKNSPIFMRIIRYNSKKGNKMWFKKRDKDSATLLEQFNKILEQWLKTGHEKTAELEKLADAVKSELSGLKAEISSMQQQIETAQKQAELLQAIPLRVPIAPSVAILRDPNYQNALLTAFRMAEFEFAPTRAVDLTQTLPSIKGIVTDTEFRTTTDRHEYILLAGLKVKYSGNDQALIELQIADRKGKPFVVDRETKIVLFPRYYTIRPEGFFGLRKTEGKGKLTFSLIGTSITTWRGL